MGRRSTVLLAASLVVAGCSQAPASPEKQSIPVEPDGGVGDGALPIPADPPLSGEFAPQAVAQIPERFRGVWDYVEGRCMASSDLRIDIGADRIEFYESLGTVESIMERREAMEREEDAVAADLASDSEPQSLRSMMQN